MNSQDTQGTSQDTQLLTPRRPSPCPKCGGLGHTDFRQPQAGYTSAEIQFCDCPAGVKHKAAVLFYEAERRAKALEGQFQRAGIPPMYTNYTCHSWRERAGTEPTKLAALKAVEAWIVGKGKKPGIFLHGKPGTGKTSLLTAALVERMRQTHERAVWLEWFDFVDEIQGRYGRGDGSAQDAVQSAQGIDLLLLDDCGNALRKTEESEDKQRLMYQIVNARMNNLRPLLMTSNLSEAQFLTQFGARTWSRIAYCCEVIEVAGIDWRGRDS